MPRSSNIWKASLSTLRLTPRSFTNSLSGGNWSPGDMAPLLIMSISLFTTASYNSDLDIFPDNELVSRFLFVLSSITTSPNLNNIDGEIHIGMRKSCIRNVRLRHVSEPSSYDDLFIVKQAAFRNGDERHFGRESAYWFQLISEFAGLVKDRVRNLFPCNADFKVGPREASFVRGI